MAQPPENLVRGRVKVYRMTAPVQVIAIGLPQDNAAASGQHANTVLRQLTHHFLLQIAKNLLTFALEKLANGTANSAFYDEIRVEKADIEPPGQLATNG